jgi:hypothetical protein
MQKAKAHKKFRQSCKMQNFPRIQDSALLYFHNHKPVYTTWPQINQNASRNQKMHKMLNLTQAAIKNNTATKKAHQLTN